jgi:uncharacterized membrane protein
VNSATTVTDPRRELAAPRITPPPAERLAQRPNAVVTVGARMYAASAVALGVVGLVSGDFAAVWHPVPTELPGRTALAYVTAVVLIASGIGLLRRRAAATSAIVLAVLYAVFAAL